MNRNRIRWGRRAALPVLVAGCLLASACGSDSSSGSSSSAAGSSAAGSGAAGTSAAESSSAAASGGAASTGESAGSGGGGSTDVTAIIENAGKSEDNSWCGTDPITLGIHDGLGANGWSKSSLAAARSEAAKCDNVEQVVQLGLGSLPDSISQVNGMVSQGIDGLVIIPDFGKSQLPSLKAATDAGVQVVPWGANPGGVDGEDYVTYADYDTKAAGKTLGDWMTEATDGTGKIVFLGGPAGNPVSVATLAGVQESFEANPGMELLTGYTDWPVTDWDAAKTQQVMASLLAQYPEIDGVIDDADGFTSLGVLRAYQSANKPLVPLATFENNSLACQYQDLKAANPDFQLATISTRNWIGRIAVRKAIIAINGGTDDQPSIYPLPLFEDSIGGLEPNCDPSLPEDAYVSAQLTPEELEQYGNAN
jgi:ribose transport system substrate-binding protein